MIKAVKIKLYPTKEQELMFIKSAGCARFAYNFGLALIQSEYKIGNSLSPTKARDILKAAKDNGEYEWIKEISADAWRNSFQDLKDAFANFYANLKRGLPFHEAGFPKFKKKHRSKSSFFHDNRKIKVFENKIYLEKIGYVKMKDDERLPKGDYKKDKVKVSDVRIGYDNKQWHLTCGIEVEEENWETIEGLSIGVDLGIKELAVTNMHDLKFKNINKTKKVKRLEKKHHRMSRQVSRKYEMNKDGVKFVKTNNIYKLERLRKKDRQAFNEYQKQSSASCDKRDNQAKTKQDCS